VQVLAGAQPQAVGSELALSEALRVTMTEDVAQTIERAESYARLRDRYVERNPAVMGGEPVITGTRVPVRTIASLIEMGETHEVLREDYPHVPEEAYPVAQLCGRMPTRVAAVPGRTRAPTTSLPVPKRRAASGTRTIMSTVAL
jgi:uncharacterized protein (DUF433 family)